VWLAASPPGGRVEIRDRQAGGMPDKQQSGLSNSFVRQPLYDTEQVRLGNNSDEFLTVKNWQATNLVKSHQVSGPLNELILTNGCDRFTHQVAYLARGEMLCPVGL